MPHRNTHAAVPRDHTIEAQRNWDCRWSDRPATRRRPTVGGRQCGSTVSHVARGPCTYTQCVHDLLTAWNGCVPVGMVRTTGDSTVLGFPGNFQPTQHTSCLCSRLGDRRSAHVSHNALTRQVSCHKGHHPHLIVISTCSVFHPHDDLQSGASTSINLMRFGLGPPLLLKCLSGMTCPTRYLH